MRRPRRAAPVNGVLVDETTYRATRQRIDYGEGEPVQAKGKSKPVPVWEARDARSRFGLDLMQGGAAFVGRRRELDFLGDALARAREERTAQLVTLVGVPGIGKSRLVYELSVLVDAEEELIFWRQGRSLPYGRDARSPLPRGAAAPARDRGGGVGGAHRAGTGGRARRR